MKYYNSFNDHLKGRFGYKVYKVPVSIGATCPNRHNGNTGCTYCDNFGSASPLIDTNLRLSEQIRRGIEWAEKKYKAKGFIVYFQSFTNTFLPIHYLDESVKTALKFDNVVGIAIGTRPDCVPEEILNLIADYAKQTYFWLEYGLQSVHEKTLRLIKRGHTFADFVDAVFRTKKRENILISTHIILGLPGETRDDIIETARVVAALPIDGIKIHLLHILKGSEMEKQYRNQTFDVLPMKDYVSLVVDVIERLPNTILVQRITGETEKERLIAPQWCLEKQKVIHEIHQEFERRGARQGSKMKYSIPLSEIERRVLESVPFKLG